MLRSILKWLVLAALAAVVFLSARHLDRNPIGTVPVPETTEQTRSWRDYTEPDPTEEIIQTEQETLPVETEPAERTFLLSFAGDCTLGAYPLIADAKQGFLKVVGDDYDYPFANVRTWFETDDFTLVNLEGPLTDSGYPTNQAQSFCGPEAYADILAGSCVEAVNLSNDHSSDYGNTGYKNTCKALKNAGISYAERDAGTLITMENGLTIGIYGMLYFKFDTKDMVREIAALRDAGADLVIVAAHWGYEGNYQPRKEETKLAKECIDAGADIVYGTHPHVLQPVEEYNGGLILYSLGSFCNGGNTAPDDFDTAIVQVEVTLDADGMVALGQPNIIPCSISSDSFLNNYQPTPYPEESEDYLRVLRKLSGTWK